MEQLPDLALQLVAGNLDVADAISIAATAKSLHKALVPHILEIHDPANDYDKLMVGSKRVTCAMLKEALKKAGLRKTGSRPVLLQRLAERYSRDKISGFSKDAINKAKTKHVFTYQRDAHAYMKVFGIDFIRDLNILPFKIQFPIPVRRLHNLLKKHYKRAQ